MLSQVFSSFFDWFRTLWVWLLNLPLPLRFVVFVPIAMLLAASFFVAIGRRARGDRVM